MSKVTLTLHDKTPVEVELDDVVNEEILHQGNIRDDATWDITELTMKSGLKIQVEEEFVILPKPKAPEAKK